MTGAGDFVKAVRDQTGYWLNYPPAQPLKLGDIVVRESGVWIPIGNVADRGVVYDTEEDANAAGAPWVSASATGVNIESSIGAAPGVFKYITDGQVGAKVTFSSGDKYLLSAAGVRFNRVKSIDAFWDVVRGEYSSWTWDLRRRIVTSVAIAESTTFLASGESAAAYELSAQAGLNVQGVDLATISAGFKLASTYNSSETFAGLANVTPLFRLHRVTFFTGSLDAAAIPDSDSKAPPTEATRLVEDDT
ncbi:hypothetical protein ACVBEQ_24725 [Nakamurella sp. GG22]